MKRFLPWMRGSGYSVKLGSVNVIYIGANARNSQHGIGVFLKHEISHLLIHQNTSSGGNNLEILKGDRQNYYSIRINRQWRICFCWRDSTVSRWFRVGFGS